MSVKVSVPAKNIVHQKEHNGSSYICQKKHLDDFQDFWEKVD